MVVPKTFTRAQFYAIEEFLKKFDDNKRDYQIFIIDGSDKPVAHGKYRYNETSVEEFMKLLMRYKATGVLLESKSSKKEKTVVINIDFPNIFNAITEDQYSDNKQPERNDFDAFIINASGKLLQNGYEIIDEHWSNNEDSLSYYIEAIKKNDIEKSNIKVILFIRLFGHFLNAKTDLSRSKYYNNIAQNNKMLIDKNSQNWQFINIVSNGHSAEDYNNAIKRLTDTLSQIETNYYTESKSAKNDIVHLSDIVKNIKCFVIYDDIKDAHLHDDSTNNK